MAFEWSALRQFRGSHVACLVGLNPTMIRKDRERSTRSASASLEGEVRGRAPSFRKRVASSRMCGSRPTAFRHLGAWTRQGRGLSGKQTVPLAAC